MHINASHFNAFIVDFLVACLITDMAGIIACFVLYAIFTLQEEEEDIWWETLHGMFRLFTFGIFKKIPL